MFARVALLLVLALPATAAAQVLVVAKSGSLYTLESNPDGSPKLVPYSGFKHVIFLGDNVPNPKPQPDPDPPPPSTLTERAKIIKAAAEKVQGDPDRDGTAKGLAMLYREVAKLVRTPGAVKDEATLTAGLSAALDSLLALRQARAQWQPVRDAFGTQWTALKFRNAPLPDYAALLDEGASGLEASAPLRKISPEFLQFIMMLIQLLMQLFKPT